MDPSNSTSHEHKEVEESEDKEAEEPEENKVDAEGEDKEAEEEEENKVDAEGEDKEAEEAEENKVDAESVDGISTDGVKSLTSEQKSRTATGGADIFALATSKGNTSRQHISESTIQKCSEEEQDPGTQTEDIGCEEEAETSPAVTEAEDLLKTAQKHTNRNQKILDRSTKRPTETSFPEGQTESASRVPDVSPSHPTTKTKEKGIRKTAFNFCVWVSPVIVVLVAILFHTRCPSPQPSEQRTIDIFHKEIEKVQNFFPSQRAELWKRSKIHLTKHLQADQPKEPASMILTSGHRAEKTLHCLALRIADALSTALNTTVLEIDGPSKATLDSDMVKLDIDERLRRAFEGNRETAVIHRFEELPPGSTLIFYRYCDHENAAFKEASLIFTVLLKDEVQNDASLSDVEEMVQEHIQDRFLSSAQPATFDKMDIDKLAGLWSRISHLILPVAAEGHIEQKGCEREKHK